MITICTYFDSNFYGRGMAMVNSIINNSSKNTTKIVVLALDDNVESKLKALNKKEIFVLTLQDLNNDFLVNKKKFKNTKEFFFSLTPSICIYCLEELKFESILYVDADVFFFNDPLIICDEIGDSSIAICSHRLPFFMKPFSNKYGIYNVGINFFRNDKIALKCLHQWNTFCNDWTPEFPGWELPFFSDQVWLNDWPQKYPNVCILDHVGINTAPWNAFKYKFSKKEDRYFVDDKPLVAYHFSNLGKLDSNTWNANIGELIIDIKGSLLDIYKDYILIINDQELTYLKGFKKNRSFIKKCIFCFSQIFFNSKVKLK